MTADELTAQFALNDAPDRTVIIKADQLAPSGVVRDIMDKAQRYGFTVIWAGAFQQP